MVDRSPNRRALLGSIGARTMALAGCTADTDEPEVGLGEIRLLNEREDDVTATVTIHRADEGVYEADHDLAGREDMVHGNDIAGRNDVVVDEARIEAPWMGDNVHYDVTVSTVGDPVETTYSTADAEESVDEWGDSECFRLTLRIGTERIWTLLGWSETCPGDD